MSADAPQTPLRPGSIEEALAVVRGTAHLLPIGAGSKPALASPPPGFTAMSLCGISGIVEYEPVEYTFTALAGTPLREVASALARNGQYLPFDPPFVEAGATVGGAIASGLSGPGRNRFGGVRDFIVGVRFITGSGELVRGGGKVVKNAAGFDIPKLLVGSIGRLGAIVEASFKVFPRPRATSTLTVRFADLAGALGAVERVNAAPFDVEALELEPPGTVRIRLGGDRVTFPARMKKLAALAGGASDITEGPAEEEFWRSLQPVLPVAGGGLLAKVPLTPGRIPEFDRLAAAAGAGRRYSAGGSIAWLSWPGEAAALDRLLRDRSLAGLVIAGSSPSPILGATRGDNFRGRVKSALDPDGRFPDFS